MLHLPLPCPHPRGSLVPCSHPSMVLFSFAPVRIPPKPKGSFHTAFYLYICHLKPNIFKEGFTATATSHSNSCCFSAFSLFSISINKFRLSELILISWKRAVDTQGRMGWHLHWWQLCLTAHPLCQADSQLFQISRAACCSQEAGQMYSPGKSSQGLD